ncbi:Pyridoxal phosphate-dependent transferase [Rhypophila decipiens]
MGPPPSAMDPTDSDAMSTVRINLSNLTLSSPSSDPYNPNTLPIHPDNALPAGRVPFGRPMRSLFNFAQSYHPLNHGSYGTFPRYVLEHKIQKLREFESRPSVYRTFVYPSQLRHSRSLVAPFLGADIDEVVLVPNATTGINTVLRNILPGYGENDVVLFPSSIYPSCWNTLRSVQEEMGNLKGKGFELVEMKLDHPITDDRLVERFRQTVGKLTKEGKRVRLAIFDTIVTGPGVRVPWEALVAECKRLGVKSLIDGAHGIGHIDLTETGKSVRPDFVVTNCHKWLFVPRGCAVLYVPFENQDLIKTALPTSHGYLAPEVRGHDREDEHGGNIFEGEWQGRGGEQGKWSEYFTNLFVDVATVDCSSYTCIEAALEFREKVCGGEETIRDYCFRLAYQGGNRAAEILGTEVMDVPDITGYGSLRRCNFANVRLPLRVVKKGDTAGKGDVAEEDIRAVVVWIYRTCARDYDTYLQTFFIGGHVWTRFSAQIYLEVSDFEWGARTLLEICERVKKGEWKGTT